MISEEKRGVVIASLVPHGYNCFKDVPGHGLCCLARMAFTVGIMCDIQNDGVPDYRYCFHTFAEASAAFQQWDGNGHPPGDWIRRKGRKGGDLRNPNAEPDPWE